MLDAPHEESVEEESVEPRARIVAVLAEGEEDVAAALAAVDPATVMAPDVEAAGVACRGLNAGLLVLDAGGAAGDADELDSLKQVADERSLELLVLLPPGSTPEGALPLTQPFSHHYLARPFAPQTLVALCSYLLGSGVAGTRPGQARASEAKSPPAEVTTAGSGDVRARRPQPYAPNRLYDDARRYVATVHQTVRENGVPRIERSRPIAEEMHLDLLRGNALVNRSLEPHEPYDLASHCVNVAIIAGKIALGLALRVTDSVDVIQAGLIHDIGMVRLPEDLLRKTGTLSEDEREEIRRHPGYGAEILDSCEPRHEWLQRAVLQEHERSRGQGYPSGLSQEHIDPTAQILGVADVFEALSHPRIYRSPFTALEALEQVVGMQDEYFPSHVVAALVNEISAFPLDSFVQLSSGEIARVVATNPANLMRPTVEVVWDAEWSPLSQTRRLDLAALPEVTVARALLDAELPIT